MFKNCPLFIILGLSAFALGCSKPFETFEEKLTRQEESAYCGTPKSISGATATVTGSAKFKYRNLMNGSTENGTAWYLDYTFGTAEVAFAEFQVTDSNGQVVQCGETDTNGDFSFVVPVSGSYTLAVMSRAYNSQYKVSVLNDTSANTPYSITKQFSVTTGTAAIGTLTAEADEKVDSNLSGGAFNILYDILQANEVLRSQANTAGFTVAPKVKVYWKAGFNPYSYFGAPNSPLSFYRPGYSELYILGGMNGDVASSDTDHFDDSVILHEYGHFLEDMYGLSNSPGGSHNGKAIIDPRLAWSEGWANYFQSFVKTQMDSSATASKLYIDTYGYKTSSSDTTLFGTNVLFDLTQVPPSATQDNPINANEGQFREVSISRTLYKTTLSNVTSYSSSPARSGGGIPFASVWQAFGSGDATAPAINGFHSSTYNFRSFGLFNSILDSLLTRQSVTKTTWSQILTDEKQPTDNLTYGAKVTAGGNCPRTIQPAVNNTTNLKVYCMIANANGTCGMWAYASNQLRSNDFFTYCYDGSTNPTISLSYSQTFTNQMLLDLYVYSNDYTYFEESLQAVGQSNSSVLRRNIASISDGDTKSVSLSGLAAGCYMINVKVRTSDSNGYDKLGSELSGTATYHLKTDGGTYLCP